MSGLMTDYTPPADKPRTKKAMTAYLEGHPRYDTGNSWNAATSYARKIKLNCLTFPDKATENAAYAIIGSDTDWWRDAGLRELIREFDERWNHSWQLGTNGRSGGYLVLYQGGTEPSGFKSYCTECGQRNYREAAAGDDVCGVCHEPTRVNYEKPPVRVFTWAYRGVDMVKDYAHWNKDALAARTEVVWDLDQTVERMAKTFIDYCRDRRVVEEVVMVPQTVRRVRKVEASK